MKLYMKAKIASIHNKIEITNEAKEPVYHIQSKVLSLHNVTYLRDAEGGDVATITGKVVSLHDIHRIEMHDGRTVELRSELLHLTRDVLDIEALGWRLEGDIVQHNYQLADSQGQVLARTHRKWLTLHNTYELEIVDETDMDLIVAVLVALDKIVADRERVMRSENTPAAQSGGGQG